MGDIADYYRDESLNRDLDFPTDVMHAEHSMIPEWRHSKTYKKSFQRWTMANRKKVRVDQMSVTHLKNAINLIKSR